MHEELIDEARNSLSEYCIKECQALCCRKGSLHFANDNEATTVMQGKSIGKRFSVRDNGESDMILPPHCPSLNSESMCTIYKHKHRPAACHYFPLFLHGKTVVIAHWCPAVQDGVLDGYKEKFKALDMKIIE